MIFGKSKKEIGNIGEEAAAKTLKKAGYKIRSRNFLSDHGEIDIIAENKEFLVFVEVKTRKNVERYFENYGRPADAVTKKKQQHIIYTAKSYLYKHPTKKAIRFDVIEVFHDDDIKINHIEDAYRAF